MYLETSRLIIRNYRLEDAQELLAIFGDEEVMKDCEPPYTLKGVKQFINRHGLKDVPHVFAMVEKSTNRLIGHAIFGQANLRDGIYEIGWILNKNFWRHGYAYEMASGLIMYGFNELKLDKIVAETIDPIKSVSLMKKLNMKEEKILREHTKVNGAWVDLYCYRILRTDYISNQL